MTAKRIVLSTFGSLGDLHPYLAVAIELKRAGHRPLIATTDIFREAVEAEGIEFAQMRPGSAELGDLAQIVRRVLHPLRGPQRLIREFVMPWVRESSRIWTARVRMRICSSPIRSHSPDGWSRRSAACRGHPPCSHR